MSFAYAKATPVRTGALLLRRRAPVPTVRQVNRALYGRKKGMCGTQEKFKMAHRAGDGMKYYSDGRNKGEKVNLNAR
jgi:hypothetical protein